MKLLSLSLAAVLVCWKVNLHEAYSVNYTSTCGNTTYYSDLIAQSAVSSWTKEMVAQLITTTHRNVLPNTSPTAGGDDISRALIDLYPGNVTGETVRLAYRDISYPAEPYGTPTSWTRSDLWPMDRGLPRTSPGLTDVHGKMAEDYAVLLRKAELFFGECGTVENQAACVSPATAVCAPTTQSDGKIFAPPENLRGNVARAVFYTQLRYEQEFGLKLTDCPPFGNTSFGYLSQLLQWHVDDPVDQDERDRNTKACGYWQGNRNPFVDYPQLVEQFYGQPDTIQSGTYTYSACTIPTQSPTATPNECMAVKPGDITVFVLNSDDPDQFVYYLLRDLPGDLTLYVTDNAYNGTTLLDNEGTLEFTVPSDGLKSGDFFGYGDGSKHKDKFKAVDSKKSFALGIQGDQIFLYCMDSDDLPHFIYGFSFGGNWSAPGLKDYGTNSSALPAVLEGVGNVWLPHKNNCLYNGTQSGTKADLQKSFATQSNWNCQNEQRFQIVQRNNDTSSATANRQHVMSATVLAAVSAMALL